MSQTIIHTILAKINIIIETQENKETCVSRWRFGLVVTSLGVSTKLLYVEPG